jgi:hypothetical protein
MSDFIDNQEVFKQESYADSQRYMQNAQDAVQKARKEDRFYQDRKYVRAASGIAYSAVLVALDAWLRLRGIVPKSKKERTTIEYYRYHIAKIDRKLLAELNNAYDTLHLAGYYDGNLSVAVIADGFNSAYNIIERIRPNNPVGWEEIQSRKPSFIKKIYSYVFV